jgi:predicted nucleic acid-binding protein
MGARVLVDSSVWIEALRDPSSRCGDALDELLGGAALVVTTGLVAQEVLQGVRDPRQVARVSTFFHALPRTSPDFRTHLRAAALRRKLRARGVNVPTVDLILAQLAIDGRFAVWSLDAHFDDIARGSRLRVHRGVGR